MQQVEEGEVIAEGPPVEAGATPGVVSVTGYAPTEVELQVNLPQTRMVVLNDLHAPGWSAEVDDVPVPIFRTNYVVRGVLVGAGEHRVRFRYETPGLALGLGVSGVTLCVCLLVVLWQLRRSRGVVANQ